jgi:hypothetical protein
MIYKECERRDETKGEPITFVKEVKVGRATE